MSIMTVATNTYSDSRFARAMEPMYVHPDRDIEACANPACSDLVQWDSGAESFYHPATGEWRCMYY